MGVLGFFVSPLSAETLCSKPVPQRSMPIASAARTCIDSATPHPRWFFGQRRVVMTEQGFTSPSSATGACRLAVDIGGTFTDVVLEHAGGRVSRKVLTTHSAPAEGFMTGVAAVMDEAGVTAKDVSLILHGATLATNALIERRGARTALITTLGHRDTLEIAYENRFAQYDIFADRSAPLVPRARRLPVAERVAFDGEVITPLDEASVHALIPELKAQKVESIAVGLLHSYAHPAHERRVGEILRAALPGVLISLSSDVCPEIREYDRQSTTTANAYVQPLIAGYLDDLKARMAAAGFRCPCLLMTSGGYLVTIETAQTYPVRLIESGPAGGAILAGRLAEELDEPKVLSFDMGGTTAKICLIKDGAPQLGRVFEVDRAHRFAKGSGFPVKIPVIEMVEIGAGGGSIARIDGLGRVRVGPTSAGSEPGPACYGRGGDQPTVTDANLSLGRLDPDGFAGGRMRLQPEASAAALAPIAEGLVGAAEPSDAGLAVVETVNEAMASAARVHAAELGEDLAGYTMIAFGGAAPLHAAEVAAKLGVDRVIVPADAGVGSAVGFLRAQIAFEVVQSRYQTISGFDAGAMRAMFGEMRAEAAATVRLAAPDAALSEQRFCFARYKGQGHEIKIPIDDETLAAETPGRLRGIFEAAYERQYGRTVPNLDIEVLTWSLTTAAPRTDTPSAPAKAAPVAPPAPEAPRSFLDLAAPRANAPAAPPAAAPEPAALTPVAMRSVRLDAAPDPVSVPVYDRGQIAAGAAAAGPACVTEPQTTTLVPAGFALTQTEGGHLSLDRGARGAAAASASQGAMADQIVWDRLIAVVEEQAQALIRTAFSTTVREAGDLSAGVFDRKGRMVAQAVTGTPGHVNAMAASVGIFLDRFPLDTMVEGDVFVTNDPWYGTGHLWDFTVVTPAFHNGAAVGLFAATVHVIDVGGRGFGPDASEVFEEGINIPIMRMFEAGAPNQPLFDILRANVRQPGELVGDLYSLAASNQVGCDRLSALLAEHPGVDFDAVADRIIERSRQAMLAEIQRLPAGSYAYSMRVDGYEAPLDLCAEMRVSAEGIDIDFAGTSGQSAYGINVPLTYTEAYASFGVRCVIGSEIPNNAGSLAPIRAAAPEGSIVNAQRPAAVAVRHVIGQMLPDVVLGCLEQAKPGSAPAEGSASLWNPMLTNAPNEPGFAVTVFHSGGAGARPGKDGLSATAFPSGVRNTPVEVTEAVAPVLYLQKEFRADSGGRGAWRGGDGQIIEIAHRHGASFNVFALFDRVHHPARGRAGGAPGAAGEVTTGAGAPLRPKGKQLIPAGQSIVMKLPGGGGRGEPS